MHRTRCSREKHATTARGLRGEGGETFSLPQRGTGDRLRWMRCVVGGRRYEKRVKKPSLFVPSFVASSYFLRDASSASSRGTFPRRGRLFVTPSNEACA